MSGEPKTLTLEEFMAELGNERSVSLARCKYPDGTEQWAARDSWGNPIEWAHTWPELGTKLRGAPVVARDEAAVESFCSKCGWAGQATAPDYRHDGCNYSAGPVSDWKLYAAQREAAELRAALRTLICDIEALAEESHLQLYDGDGALVDTSWGKVLEGGKDEYLSNWNEAKRLAGGESRSAL